MKLFREKIITVPVCTAAWQQFISRPNYSQWFRPVVRCTGVTNHDRKSCSGSTSATNPVPARSHQRPPSSAVAGRRRPLSFSLVTAGALAMAAALIAFGYWGEVTRKVTVLGVLLPVGGLINITAPRVR